MIILLTLKDFTIRQKGKNGNTWWGVTLLLIKQLIRVTLRDLRYTTMKEQLKRAFAKTVTTEWIEAQRPKSEFPFKFESDDSSGREDVYFSDKRSSFQKREDNKISVNSVVLQIKRRYQIWLKLTKCCQKQKAIMWSYIIPMWQ